MFGPPDHRNFQRPTNDFSERGSRIKGAHFWNGIGKKLIAEEEGSRQITVW
jgi:hypothetical protein